MKNPWTLKITVKEKTRVGCVKSGKKYSYFDQTKLVVNETEVKDSKIPVVSGLKIKKILIGNIPKNILIHLYAYLQKKASIFE